MFHLQDDEVDIEQRSLTTDGTQARDLGWELYTTVQPLARKIWLIFSLLSSF